MAKAWRQRLRRGHLAWLGRIEGVEKPAILLGFGLVLYRVWRSSDLVWLPKGRVRSVLEKLREQLKRGFARESGRETGDEEAPVDDGLASAAEPGGDSRSDAASVGEASAPPPRASA